MEASNDILDQVVKSIAIPRRHSTTIRGVGRCSCVYLVVTANAPSAY
ncbi:hypothetical protein ACT691_13005 [Vibrio metschnikovii]